MLLRHSESDTQIPNHLASLSFATDGWTVQWTSESKQEQLCFGADGVNMSKHVLRSFSPKQNKKENVSTKQIDYGRIENYLLKPLLGVIPIHVCGKSIATAPSRWMGWALKPFGFQGFPVNIIKDNDKTIIQIETGKHWMVYEWGLLTSWACKPFPFTNKIPVKIFKDGTKSIIQIEAFEGVFCDCNHNNEDDIDSSEDLDESFENNTDSGRLDNGVNLLYYRLYF